MEFTQADLESAGYHLKTAPRDAWRNYDERHPVPKYFDFDWLSARHPDLYDRFALDTSATMEVLGRLVDLAGMDVVDVAAGTGRSASAAAKTARSVTAVDVFDGVIGFGKERMRQAGLSQVRYVQADRAQLPFADDAFDACLSSWAELSYPETYRVLKPNGYLIQLVPAPGALCGELTALLAASYPHLITEIAPPEQFDPAYAPLEVSIPAAAWQGLPLAAPILRYDFTHRVDYGNVQEAAALFGRFYGPLARRYFLDRQQSSCAWRKRIEIVRVKKGSTL